MNKDEQITNEFNEFLRLKKEGKLNLIPEKKEKLKTPYWDNVPPQKDVNLIRKNKIESVNNFGSDVRNVFPNSPYLQDNSIKYRHNQKMKVKKNYYKGYKGLIIGYEYRLPYNTLIYIVNIKHKDGSFEPIRFEQDEIKPSWF
jgi:hypothetical protein